MENIYVIGHQSPDLDSVASAIAYAFYKNKLLGTDIYKPAVCGELNKESKYVLDKFGFSYPEVLEDASGKKIILVDHNEQSQMVEGGDKAEIIEIIDHHKINFSYDKPIDVLVKPWGATCSILADLYLRNKVEVSAEMAGLMLSAILVDTVITKSPTCTEIDKEIIDNLSKKAGIADWQEYGMELFKVRSDIADLKDDEIIFSDFKDFEFSVGKIGVGQVETADLSVFKNRFQSFMEEMNKIKQEKGYYAVILFITDIINEGSQFLVVADDTDFFEKAFATTLENGQVYLENLMSRKKQVIPKLQAVL